MVGLGSYAVVKSTRMVVQAISSPYLKDDQTVINVRLVFDPMVEFTANVEDLEVMQELEP